MLEDISGRQMVDRLPVLVSGAGVQQLLGVPKLLSGKGEVIANSVYDLAVSWGISERIKFMCFDTTASNTGIKSGACVLLEKKMNANLIWLPCRHHILEILLESVVLSSIGPSSGPDILLFKRFQKNWPLIKTDQYESFTCDSSYSTKFPNADELIKFCNDQLDQYQPREDYRELLELAILFLGGVLNKHKQKFSFKAPAGLHRARWMSKSIYALKIFMFKKQFKLTKMEENGIREICISTIKIYIMAWYRSPSAVQAPFLDLQLLKHIDNYKNENKVLSQILLKKYVRHLWYLSEELVALSFFDPNVSLDTKRKMLTAVNKHKNTNIPPKVPVIKQTNIQKMNLEDFVTSNTNRFFEITGISSSFMTKCVEEWTDDPDFKMGQETVSNLKVINDIAERGVALMTEYNKLQTNDEEQKQFLLLVVQKHRNMFPDQKKSTLCDDDKDI